MEQGIMTKRYVNVFVLGAGASVDYGLPVWDKLKELLIEEITINGAVVISSDVTNRLLRKLEDIGPGRTYETVDEMIAKFDDDEASEITGPIFDVVKRVFNLRARTKSVGWIETFMDKNNVEILLGNETSGYPSVFINFNYDTLLLSKIVRFFKKKFKNTPKSEIKDWRLNHGAESDFGLNFEHCAKDIFHPHGILYLCDSDDIKIGRNTACRPTSNTFRNARTRGTDLEVSHITLGVDNAISCHETRPHFTFSDIKGRIRKLAGGGQGDLDIRLIVLGVGPISLEFNMNKIFKGETFEITEVYYTCKEDNERHVYEGYFSRFDAPTERYKDCRELVEKKILIPFD